MNPNLIQAKYIRSGRLITRLAYTNDAGEEIPAETETYPSCNAAKAQSRVIQQRDGKPLGNGILRVDRAA